MANTATTFAVLLALVPLLVFTAAAQTDFLQSLTAVDLVASTVPANGDVNPYGVFIVPKSVGNLVKGNLLVSNFNNASNVQGTGTTIVQISPDGQQTLFAQLDPTDFSAQECPGGIGLTTALVVLRRGWVIVGSLPTVDNVSQNGCLIVLDANGVVHHEATISGGLIRGPWDATVIDHGSIALLFVTNVLNGQVATTTLVVNEGTVVRISLDVPQFSCESSSAPSVKDLTIVGSGFGTRTDPNALIIGPTGLGIGLDRTTLYVADTLNNRISALPMATMRTTTAYTGTDVTANGLLNGPLGLVVAPNGNILVANGNDGLVVEIQPSGQQLSSKQLDSTNSTVPPGAGCLFGIATTATAVYFVDDCSNALLVLH